MDDIADMEEVKAAKRLGQTRDRTIKASQTQVRNLNFIFRMETN